MNKSSARMINELQSALHDSSLTKAEYIRIQAVLMRKLKQRRRLIARLVGKSLSVVEDWITAYHQRGLPGLRTKKRLIQPRSLLSNEQRRHLHTLLNKKPKTLRINGEKYWTMQAVKTLVKRETGVVYKGVNAYRKLLQDAGLSYQKVEQIDAHQNKKVHDDFQKQFEAKVKGGRISMWW